MGAKEDESILGMFGQLDFTMLWPILVWHAFETYKPFISLIFTFFQGAVNHRY
jgi:hypothetical protein